MGSRPWGVGCGRRLWTSVGLGNSNGPVGLDAGPAFSLLLQIAWS